MERPRRQCWLRSFRQNRMIEVGGYDGALRVRDDDDHVYFVGVWKFIGRLLWSLHKALGIGALPNLADTHELALNTTFDRPIPSSPLEFMQGFINIIRRVTSSRDVSQHILKPLLFHFGYLVPTKPKRRWVMRLVKFAGRNTYQNPLTATCQKPSP